jgi:putative ABC transport system permease protein
MILSIFKQIWNQKRKNAFIVLEMFLLFALIFGGSYYLAEKVTTLLIPFNFQTENRIMLQVVSNTASDEQHREDRDKLVESLSMLEGIRLVSRLVDGPFGYTVSSSMIKVDTNEVNTEFRAGDPNLVKALGLEMIEGTWFDQASLNLYASVYPFDRSPGVGEGEEFKAHGPVVIDRLLAEKIAGQESALGKKLIIENRSCVVIGVIEPVKREAFSKPNWAIYLPTDWWISPWFMELVLVIDPEYDLPLLMEQINQRLFTTLDKETWHLQTLATMDFLKSSEIEKTRVELIYITFLALFLLFTALLGLTGIFSFNINKRKPEIGVLRAIGSSQSQLQKRLVMEMIFISLLGILPAIFFLIQIPMLKIMPLEIGFYYRTLVGTLIFVLTLVGLFAWYPAYKASRMEPALALKDE